jgi:MtaA/CmuA family methyltransferase
VTWMPRYWGWRDTMGVQEAGMRPREIFMARLERGQTARAATGSATSVVTSDLMDAAGAGFPAAHLDSEAMAQLAAAGHTLLGFDNVMPLFSVWRESAALGCDVDWGERGRMPDGRAIYDSIDTPIEIPSDFLDHPGCAVPLEALRLLKKDLGEQAAVVGKVFGPWTLAYHLFGVQTFLIATLDDPERVRAVLRKLMTVTIAFAEAQIECGADALTLADHCTRDLCSPLAYRDFLAELHRELRERIPVPLILHICGDTSDRLPYIRETGLASFHYDSKVPTGNVRALAGARLGLMGGTSNFDVVLAGTPERIEVDVREKLAAGVDILGPECAVPLDAPWENLRILAETARRLSGA